MDNDRIDDEEIVDELAEENEDEAEAAEGEDASASQFEDIADVTQIYLNDIGNNALLTPDQERALARRVVQGDFEARQKMIEHNLRLVVNIAKH